MKYSDGELFEIWSKQIVDKYDLFEGLCTEKEINRSYLKDITRKLITVLSLFEKGI